jgi:hypothetical protein
MATRGGMAGFALVLRALRGAGARAAPPPTPPSSSTHPPACPLTASLPQPSFSPPPLGAIAQSFDNGIRQWNPNASLYSGNIDSCGFPLDPGGLGFSRRTNCFYEDFSQGFDDSRLQISQAKSCCAKVRAPRAVCRGAV